MVIHMNKKFLFSLLLGSTLVLSNAQADWLESAKEGAASLWDKSKEKAQELSETETAQNIKDGSVNLYEKSKDAAGDVIEDLSKKETYQNAWEKTKEISSDVYDKAKHEIKEASKDNHE